MFMKDNLKTIKLMVKEYLVLEMGVNMKVNGKIINNLVMENIMKMIN